MTTAVEADIEPPGLPDDPDEPDGDPTVDVFVSVVECDETRRAGVTSVPGDADDWQVADALVRSLLGCAALRGPGLVDAVRARMTAELSAHGNGPAPTDRNRAAIEP